MVNSFKFLGVHITEDLTWSTHTDAVLKEEEVWNEPQHPQILLHLHCGEHPDRLHHRLVWKQHRWQPQSSARVVRTARHIVGGELPSLQDIYTRRCIRKARRIIKDSSHPSHRLLSLLPSGRRLRSIRSRTSRLRDSFSLRLSGKWTVRNNSPYITLPLTQSCHALHFNTVIIHTAIIQPICYHWIPYNAHPRHCICIICCTFAQLSIAQLICL